MYNYSEEFFPTFVLCACNMASATREQQSTLAPTSARPLDPLLFLIHMLSSPTSGSQLLIYWTSMKQIHAVALAPISPAELRSYWNVGSFQSSIGDSAFLGANHSAEYQWKSPGTRDFEDVF